MQPRARDSRFALANLPCVYRTQSSSQAPAVHASGEVELMLQAYRYSASTHNLDRALYGNPSARRSQKRPCRCRFLLPRWRASSWVTLLSPEAAAQRPPADGDAELDGKKLKRVYRHHSASRFLQSATTAPPNQNASRRASSSDRPSSSDHGRLLALRPRAGLHAANPGPAVRVGRARLSDCAVRDVGWLELRR